MTDAEPTRRQRRRALLRAKHKKQREDALRTEQESGANATSAQGDGDSSTPHPEPILQSAQDLRVWNELEANPEWQIPKKAFELAPQALLAMFANKELKGSTRIQALGKLVQMQKANADSHKTRASFEFNIHRHYQTRHTHAETPEPDETISETTVDAIGYRELISDDEAAEALKELETLGLLPHLLKMDTNGESKNGAAG